MRRATVRSRARGFASCASTSDSLLTVLKPRGETICSRSISAKALSCGVMNTNLRRTYVSGRQGQAHHSTHPHLVKPGEVTPGTTKEEYAERRARFLHNLPAGSIALIPAAPERLMTNDIPYVFHQNNNFLYLCGYQEPDALLVLCKKNGGQVHMTMFVRPKDPARELWDGPRSGIEGAIETFGADEAYPISELETRIGAMVSGMKYVFMETNIHPTLYQQISSTLKSPVALNSPKLVLEQMRVRKSTSEINIMRKSTKISGEAFAEIMRFTAPGMMENILEARYEFEIKRRGSQRIAYPPVFASGINANTLHYIANDSILKEGDLILVDAGGEYNNFVSDITRTWPVSGRYTKAQKEVYEAVLYIQQEIIRRCWAGADLDNLHHLSVKLAQKALKEMGVPKAPESYFKYYPHSIGHWVGMDVHDVPGIGTSLSFEPGMMCTVEPGLYFGLESHIPQEYRGIGIRIEDDVLITNEEPEVLTRSAPKQISEIENLMSKS